MQFTLQDGTSVDLNLDESQIQELSDMLLVHTTEVYKKQVEEAHRKWYEEAKRTGNLVTMTVSELAKKIDKSEAFVRKEQGL
jgi:alpha-ketoglutarate-dependent taurine dioxygenase